MIARGAGTTPEEVTLYDKPGVHIFMNIDGRFFGTSDGGGGGNPRGGAGWLADGASDASSRAFRRYYVLPSILRDKTAYGHIFGFQLFDPGVAAGAEVGDKVSVGYEQLGNGSLAASALSFAGAVTTTGTVTAIDPSGASLTISVAGGGTVTVATALVPELLSGVVVGDTIQVTYSTDPSGALVPHALTIVATVAPEPVLPTSDRGAPTSTSTPTTAFAR